MLRSAFLAFSLTALVAGCGSKQSTPAPSNDGVGEPAPDPADEPAPAEMTEDECTAAGGTAKWDIGDGQVACDPGDEQIARIPVGIEGGICCRPAPDQ